MIDEKKVKEAVAEFTKNPYWKAKLDEAPTELSRRDTELGFYRSFFRGAITNEERDEILEERRNLKDKFGLEDWKHARKYCGHNPFYAVCSRKIEELEAQQTK